MSDADEHTLDLAAGELPAAQVGARIGRYQLLELVGTGGMGLVWGAWDPELERRVALKLVRLVRPGAQERMLREGQVLARLSHPNVVPIYDVGVMGEQVYLVMEWVAGTTLKAYADQQPTERDLLDAYRQAGAGLAAVHAAGVIHRDFKPANAIRGDDGRVRVLDFGIAFDEASPLSSGGGTPRYMAPEQQLGEGVTAASDQFAFCISLLDAFGPDATPRWIGAIIERGTDPDPARRFPSMQAVLDELARDPARRRRRAALGVALVGAAVGAFAIGRTGSPDAAVVEPCSGEAIELAYSWNPALREHVVTHLRTLGPLAEGEQIAGELDRYGTRWMAVHDRACRAHERKELTLPLYETRLGCLTRTRSQLAAVGELMSSVAAADLPQALLAARSLPDVEGCADIAGAVVPPPAAMTERVRTVVPEVERALVLATAKHPGAAQVGREAVARARETGYDPLVARALLVAGQADTVDPKRDGRELFAEAMRRALRASDDVLAVEAYARWIFELVRWGETTFDHWDVMNEVAGRLGRDGRFARALMLNNRAVGFLLANDHPNARALLEQALAVAGDHESLELRVIRLNLARLEREPTAYATALRAIHDRLAAALGPRHPDTLGHKFSLALLDHDRARARAAMNETCAGYAAWQHHETARLCTFEAAMLAIDAGDREQAVALMEDVIRQSRALEMRDGVIAWVTGLPRNFVDIRRPIAEAYVARVRGLPTRAARTAALERRIAAQGNEAWHRLETVDALIVLEQWVRADQLFRTVEQSIYVRKRAQILRGLAGVLAKPNPTRARELAREARTYYEVDPGAAATVAELDGILTTAAR